MFTQKYKPVKPIQLVGAVQRKIAENYKEAIDAGNPIAPQLLFGSSGVGKTTIAKMVATMLEEQGRVQVINYNCVDTSGVDDAREITQGFRTYPLGGGYKVFIFDEIHQLSSKAQDAFLIPLDELNQRTDNRILVFAATTSLKSVHNTFISRFVRVNLPEPNSRELVRLGNTIAKLEDFELPHDDISYLIGAANGNVRDFVTMLEEYSKGNKLEELGTSDTSDDFIKLLINDDLTALLQIEDNYNGLFYKVCNYAIKVLITTPNSHWAGRAIRVFGAALMEGTTIDRVAYATLLLRYFDST